MDKDTFYAKDRATWRQWLAENHDKKQSVWLVFDKGKDRKLSYDDIVKEALCFGWIDSKPGKISDTQSMLYISKRKPKSMWSKLNKDRITELTAQGLMMPAGQAAIDVAQQNGSWDTLNRSDNFEIPEDLAAGLQKNPKAKAFYDAMPPSSKKIILEWIYSAKREATRKARIQETIELAAQGIRAHHYSQ